MQTLRKYLNYNSLRQNTNLTKKYFSEKDPVYKTLKTNIITPTKVSLASPPSQAGTPIPPNQQLTEPGTKKTPQELNIERLMEQWPESIRNPKTDIGQNLKNILANAYKFHDFDKPYHKHWDLPEDLFVESSAHVYSARTTDNISEVFQEWEGFLTDHQKAVKFYEICVTHKDFTSEFYEVIVPEVKKMLTKADKGSNLTLFLCTAGASFGKFVDTEFWDIIVIITINLY